MKKILALFMVISMLGTGFAFASNDIMPISTNPSKTTNLALTNTITINGVIIDSTVIRDKDGDMMLPLKPIAEALGYQVSWQSKDKRIEVVKGARFITLKTTVNSVSFSKMAPTALSKKAIIIKGITYVPKDFVETYFETTILESDNNIEIITTLDESISTGGFIITTIEKDRIIVSLNGGESHIMLKPDTKYFDYKTQKSITLSDLKVGDTLKVTHPAMMIMIYPAQYSAILIERINDVAYTEGTIMAVNDGSILVKGYLMNIQINISKETIIENMNQTKIDVTALKVGNKVKVYHSLMMTKSLPPQSLGFKIIVDTFLK